ncbi:MAG TPA: hypothetical protein VL463_25160 [Kofleriaceae bacterium]|nr:hypothetical protein [Kofleriaceae bacterium]
MILAIVALVPTHVIVVGRAAPDASWTDAPTEARTTDHAELAVVAIARDGDRTVVLADDDVAPLVIRGRTIAARERRAWPLGASVRWSTIEPFAWHQPGEVVSNGNTADYHSNVSTEPKDFGRWLGYDQLRYFATTIADFGAARTIAATITPHDTGASAVDGAGTIFYQATVRFSDNSELSSPGAEAVDEGGIQRSVHRVSLRLADDFLGRLSAYLLVPEVFGSAGGGASNQTDRYTGADCADVMVGALRAEGHREIQYTNVAGLPALTRVIAKPTILDDQGNPATPITGVARGDLIRIDYGGDYANMTPRDWDHVAALWEDRSDPDGPAHGGPDGQLDGFDLVIHMGHPRLVIEPLANQAPATVDVLRWRAKAAATSRPARARTSR